MNQCVAMGSRQTCPHQYARVRYMGMGRELFL